MDTMPTAEMTLNDSFDSTLINSLTVEQMLNSLEPEEHDLISLWMSGSFTLEEIGRLIGQKYHGEDVKSSVIRYHRDKILRKLRQKFYKEKD